MHTLLLIANNIAKMSNTLFYSTFQHSHRERERESLLAQTLNNFMQK